MIPHRIGVRNVRPEDKEKIRGWRNRPSVAQSMYTDHLIAPAEHERWFKRILDDAAVQYWIITYNGEDVGLVNLYDINKRHQRCYWAFYVAQESFKGKGVGAFVEYFILEYVFRNLGLNKLCCEVLSSNLSVVQMHKSFGFKEEGCFRQHVVKGGKPTDIHCLAILREEWKLSRPSTEERLRKIADRRQVEWTDPYGAGRMTLDNHSLSD